VKVCDMSQDWGVLRVQPGKVEVRLMAGEVEIVLMTPQRTDHERPQPRARMRLSWAKAWIIGKADLTMNGCLYDSTLL
jgi:hypothetical protein